MPSFERENSDTPTKAVLRDKQSHSALVSTMFCVRTVTQSGACSSEKNLFEWIKHLAVVSFRFPSHTRPKTINYFLYRLFPYLRFRDKTQTKKWPRILRNTHKNRFRFRTHTHHGHMWRRHRVLNFLRNSYYLLCRKIATHCYGSGAMSLKEPRSNAHATIASQLQLQRQNTKYSTRLTLYAKCSWDTVLFFCWRMDIDATCVHFTSPCIDFRSKICAWSFFTYLSAAENRQFIAWFDWMNATAREKWQPKFVHHFQISSLLSVGALVFFMCAHAKKLGHKH